MADDVKGQKHLVDRQVAMSKVFVTFAAVWQKAFHANRTRELLPVWLGACGGVSTDMLERAALKFVSEAAKDYPPKPRDFASFARAMERQHAPASDTVQLQPSTRRWEWMDPESQRIRYVEEHSTGWVGVAEIEIEAMGGLGEFVRHCNVMANRYPIGGVAA